MKKRNSIICAIILIFLLLTLCFCFIANDKKATESIRIEMDFNGEKEIFNVFSKDGKLYFLLPSGANFDITRIYCSPSYSLSTEEVSSNEYLVSVYNPFGIRVAKKELVVMTSANIPSLYISLEKGTLDDINSDTLATVHSDNKTKLSGNLIMNTSEGKSAYSGKIDYLSGRGNSSWSQAKKPYTLKMKNECELISGVKAQNYVLVANGCDDSNLRNKIVFDAAKAAGLKYTPETSWIDLYVDGNYIGLYLLTTKIEVSKYSVPISELESSTQEVNAFSLSSYPKYSTEIDGTIQKGYQIPVNPEDITGGYLLEFELPDRVANEDNLFITKSDLAISVKYPSVASKEQITYISNYVQNMEDVLDTDEIQNYIDMDSWVNYYLLQEMFANDSRTSYFFYKDSDKVDSHIFAGPAWDYDLTLGTAYSPERKSPDAFTVNTWGWYEKLYTNDAFYSDVVDRYNKFFLPYAVWLCDTGIQNYCNTIAQSYKLNYIRWNGIQEFEYCDHYDNLDEHADSIEQFLNNRTQFLNSEWNNGEYVKSDEVNNVETTNNDTQNDVSQTEDGILSKITHYLKILYHNPEPYITYLGVIIFGLLFLVLIYWDFKQIRKGKNEKRSDEGKT